MLSNVEMLHWVEYLINEGSERLDDGLLSATVEFDGLTVLAYDEEDGETIVGRMRLELPS